MTHSSVDARSRRLFDFFEIGSPDFEKPVGADRAGLFFSCCFLSRIQVVKRIGWGCGEFAPPETAATANADPNVLTQVLENLVSNAVKYSPPDRSIFVRLKQLPGTVRFEVQDEGPGLSAEDQQKLFGKFARLTAKPTGDETSTGLGLSIVKRMVEAMNGEVWCESEAGQGATFIVELPAA